MRVIEYPEDDFDIDEIERQLQKRATIINNTPQLDFGGLTPNQMMKLIHGGWGLCWKETRKSQQPRRGDLPFDPCLMLKNEASPADVMSSKLLTGCRILLRILDETGAARLTKTGALPLALITRVLNELRSQGIRPDLPEVRKVTTEYRCLDVHIPRILCELSGMIRFVKGKCLITKMGLSMLDDDKSGEFVARLVYAFFTRFNISYLDGYDERYSFQSTTLYTFFRLGVVARRWRKIHNLAKVVVVPAVVEDLSVIMNEYSTVDDFLSTRLLRHLVAFGLLETQEKPYFKTVMKMDKVRVTPLWDKVFEFKIG